MNNLNKHIVIIGGGAAGLSTAYHLAKLGCPNVLLLERNQLTSGTSWHAAGIVGPLRATQNLTTLSKYALKLLKEIEAETGQATGYKQTGGLWLTRSHDRVTELKRIAAMGQMNDLHAQFLTPNEVKQRYELLNVSDLVGGMWLDQDGQVNPVDMCMALARGARMHGVEIRENAGVAKIDVDNGVAQSIMLDDGDVIDCDIIVNCAGLWARDVGELAGVNVPLQAVAHMYVVTEPIDELPIPCPVVRDMEGALYIKEDAGKLVLGIFESNAKIWDHKSVDPKSSFLMFDEDWDHAEPMLQRGIHRIPHFEKVGLTHFMTGPESFTPDTKQLMGRSAEVDNFYVAAGFNSLGIMSSPGVGKAMADWVVQGRSTMDLWEVDMMRFQFEDNDLGFLHSRIPESVSNQFDMHWPNKQFKTGRDRKHSVWHEKMLELGGVFGAPGLWERPLWFARSGEPNTLQYSYAEQNWWPVAKRESEMLAKTGAFFELSLFTKIEITGRDALAAMQWLCSKNVDVDIGKVVYTLMLNESGGIEGELTVIRTDENTFLAFSASATRIKDVSWISRNITQYETEVRDITDEYSILGVMGPNARMLLSSLVDIDCFGSTRFSFAESRVVQLDGIEARVTRLSYVGELGWEVMVSNHQAKLLLDKCIEGGRQYDMAMAGFLTMECCRMEKGYLHWGHDIGPEENPYMANLGFAVSMSKPTGFIGHRALQNQNTKSPDRQLFLFETIGSTPLLLHDEPIFLNHEWVGRTTSGGVGMRVNKHLCLGYIDMKNRLMTDVISQQFEVQVAGQMYSLLALKEPPYDPQGLRMRG